MPICTPAGSAGLCCGAVAERWRSSQHSPPSPCCHVLFSAAVSPLTAHALQPDSTASHRDLARASLCRGSARRLRHVPALHGVLPVATAARWRRGLRVAIHAFVLALPGLSAAVRSRPSGELPRVCGQFVFACDGLGGAATGKAPKNIGPRFGAISRKDLPSSCADCIKAHFVTAKRHRPPRPSSR
jgi:hypothetical protein